MKKKTKTGPKTTRPEPLASTEFTYVEFYSSGKAEVHLGSAEVYQDDQGQIAIKFTPGVTGHESYYVTDLNNKVNYYRDCGIWPCAGTKNRWNAMYIHGWEFDRLWAVLNIDKYVEQCSRTVAKVEETEKVRPDDKWIKEFNSWCMGHWHSINGNRIRREVYLKNGEPWSDDKEMMEALDSYGQYLNEFEDDE